MVWGLLPVSLGTDSLLSPEIHKEAGDSSLRLLQEHHQWLERYPQWPAGPVSTVAPGLGWIPGVCPPVLGRGHSPATSRHWLMGALCRTSALTVSLPPGTMRSMPSAPPAPTASPSARIWPPTTCASGSRMSPTTRESSEALALCVWSGWAWRGAPGTDGSYPNRVPPNLRSAIYCSMVATGGEDAWNFIWDRFREAPVVSEADKLRTALSCSPHPWILNRCVWGLAGTVVCPHQPITHIMSAAPASPSPPRHAPPGT